MNKKELTEKEVAELERKRQLAILKASNELLEYAKDTAKNTDKINDELTRAKNVKALEKALTENKMKAQYLNATMDEVNNSTYREVSEAEKKKYEERLKKRGITEEQIERIDVVSVSVGEKSTKKSSKRKHIPSKSKTKIIEETEEIVRLENEEELMKSMMATDEKIVEKRKKDTKQEDKELKKLTDSIDNKKVKDDSIIKEGTANFTDIEDTNKKTTNKKSKVVKYKFDTSKIPENVQYDVVTLPSKGECYPIDSPLRCGRVPVAYITASDENIIASPMMYRDDKILDIILERKILLVSKEDIHNLVKGDRDAIILWLRATAYDNPNFPIIATNPKNGKKYDLTIDLSKFNYKDFNLEGDENGHFEFVISNGDVIKYRYLTKHDEDELIEKLYDKTNNHELLNVLKYTNWIKEAINNISFSEESDKTDIEGCLEDIETIIRDNAVEMDDEEIFIETVTEQMIMNTYSVNGNTDRDFIRSYIENMRSNNAFNYRKHINDDTPGIDFKITVDIPESDGGGSFTTFFRFSDTIFINL